MPPRQRANWIIRYTGKNGYWLADSTARFTREEIGSFPIPANGRAHELKGIEYYDRLWQEIKRFWRNL
jgi:hypothetical protein